MRHIILCLIITLCFVACDISNSSTLPRVSINDVSVREPDSNTTTLSFTISIDKALDTDITFDYKSSDISALAGSDYVGIGTTMGTITAGDTATTVTVTIKNNVDVSEINETFTLNLSNFNQTLANLTTDGIQGIGTILVDQGPPQASDDVFYTAYISEFITGNVLTNDTLTDNAVYSSHDGTSPAGSGVIYNGDGTFTYTTWPGLTGTDSFTYTIIDEDGEIDTATVSIGIGGIN